MEEKKREYAFKIILFGDERVGKTSLKQAQAKENFEEDYRPTIGVDFGDNILDVANTRVRLKIWDIGSKYVADFNYNHYKNTHAVVHVFDLTSQESLNNVQSSVDVSEKFAPKNAVQFLVGTKSDLEKERTVTKEQAENKAKEHNMEYHEMSAKTGDGVNEFFTNVAKKLVETFADEMDRKWEKDHPQEVALKKNKDIIKGIKTLINATVFPEGEDEPSDNPWEMGFWYSTKTAKMGDEKITIPKPILKIHKLCEDALDPNKKMTPESAVKKITDLVENRWQMKNFDEKGFWYKLIQNIRSLLGLKKTKLESGLEDIRQKLGENNPQG